MTDAELKAGRRAERLARGVGYTNTRKWRPIFTDVARRMAAERVRAGESPKYVAKDMGMSESSVHRYCKDRNGNVTPPEVRVAPTTHSFALASARPGMIGILVEEIRSLRGSVDALTVRLSLPQKKPLFGGLFTSEKAA